MSRKIEDNYKSSIQVDKKNIRLDIFLNQYFDSISRTKIKDYIKENKILINNHSVRPSYILKGDEIIDYDFSVSNPLISIKPQKINLDAKQ